MSMSEHRKTALALEACVLVALALCPFREAAGETSETRVPQSRAAQRAPVPEARVTGQVLAAPGQPAATRRVLLIRVRLLDLMGAEVKELPPQGTAIVDADFKTPAATAPTDVTGRFSFEGVKPGRYSVAVVSTTAAGGAVLVQRPQDRFDTLVFDVAAGQVVDLGGLQPRKE